jgi:glycosyltransferase involved in cell wall biosynthesis
MRIALDATYAIGPNLSGVGLYSREILSGLAALQPEVRFDFCCRPHRYSRRGELPAARNVRVRLFLDPLMPRGAGLFHGLNQRLPRMRFRRTVATFHDLFVMTGDYSTAEFRARFTAQARQAARRADLIIAVSAFTKSQVVALLDVPESRVRVIHHGTRPLFFPSADRQPVILNVGAIQKRKNITRLVEAFETVDPEWRLVLAGSAGYGAREILDRIGRSPARQRISVLGYVSQADLAAWYRKAAIFAFPSLDEGFGMPVLEAMAAGTPVIASNRSALPEVAGEAALLVDPEDTSGVASALKTLIQNEDFRRELAQRGICRAQCFTWEKAVRETWQVYQELLA